MTVLGLTLEAGTQLRQDAIADFTQKTGIQVDMIPTPGNSAEQTALMLKLLGRHATSPDVYLVDVVWPGTLHEHLLDLTPFLNDESRKHLPALFESGIVAQRVVGLPFYTNTGMLYYRADLLEKYGYASPPNTWDELATMAQRIQRGERQQGKKDFWGYLWQGAAYEGLTCNALEWQVSFGGGRIVETDGTVTVNNAQAERALVNAAKWVGSISPESVLSYLESDSLNVFSSGNAAFLRHWSSAFRSIREATHSGKVGVTSLPAGPAGRAHTIGGFHLAVSRYSTQPAAAAALVLYLTGEEVETRRALKRGYIPTYAELYSRPDLIAVLPQVGVLHDYTAGSWVARPAKQTGDKYSEVSKAYFESVHAILARKVRARAALSTLSGELRNITGARDEAAVQKHGR